MDLTLASPLSDAELVTLTHLEAVIDRNQFAFLEVGEALSCIRDGRLYRHTHNSFEAYCEERWSFSSSYARRILKARQVLEVIPTGAPVLPENERQARALAPIPEAKRAEVWEEAVKRGGDALRASRLVREVFADLTHDEQHELRREAARSTAGLRSSVSNEWYTPTPYLASVRQMFGGRIGLDPATCPEAQAYVQAERCYTQADNGLTLDWLADSVFCNPPYGQVEKQGSVVRFWVEKALDEHEAGHAPEVILLLNAFTSSGWFAPLWDHTLCFVSKRIHFVSPTQAGAAQPAHGSVFAYLGPNHERFAALFAPHGAVVRRYQPEEF